MLQFLRDFFWNKQTAASAMADVAAVVTVAAASPAGTEYLSTLGAWGPMVAAGMAYMAGAASGRHTQK